MKEKILKAIDKGLMNVLSTDIEDQNIDFEHDDINSEYSHFLTIDELRDMFYEDNDSIFKPLGNTKSALSLILEDGKEISLFEYNADKNPVFIKISNDMLAKNDGVIYIDVNGNHQISSDLPWINDNIFCRWKLLPEKYFQKIGDYPEKYDFNGYNNCMQIMQTINDPDFEGYDRLKRFGYNRHMELHAPAVEYCMGIESPIFGYEGYLPSAGQMFMLKSYIYMINHVLKHIGCESIDFGDSKSKNSDEYVWWTSSEMDGDYAYVMKMFGDIRREPKTCHHKVLPFFKQI